MRIVKTIVVIEIDLIISRASDLLAKHQVNILNINQNITDDFFNMVLICDMSKATICVEDLKDKAAALGKELGLEIRVQSEEIFTAMHRI